MSAHVFWLYFWHCKLEKEHRPSLIVYARMTEIDVNNPAKNFYFLVLSLNFSFFVQLHFLFCFPLFVSSFHIRRLPWGLPLRLRPAPSSVVSSRSPRSALSGTPHALLAGCQQPLPSYEKWSRPANGQETYRHHPCITRTLFLPKFQHQT